MAGFQRGDAQTIAPVFAPEAPSWLAVGQSYMGGFYEGVTSFPVVTVGASPTGSFESFTFDLLERMGPSNWGVTGWAGSSVGSLDFYLPPEIGVAQSGHASSRIFGNRAYGQLPLGLAAASYLMGERELPQEEEPQIFWPKRRRPRLSSSPVLQSRRQQRPMAQRPPPKGPVGQIIPSAPPRQRVEGPRPSARKVHRVLAGPQVDILPEKAPAEPLAAQSFDDGGAIDALSPELQARLPVEGVDEHLAFSPESSPVVDPETDVSPEPMAQASAGEALAPEAAEFVADSPSAGPESTQSKASRPLPTQTPQTPAGTRPTPRPDVASALLRGHELAGQSPSSTGRPVVRLDQKARGFRTPEGNEAWTRPVVRSTGDQDHGQRVREARKSLLEARNQASRGRLSAEGGRENPLVVSLQKGRTALHPRMGTLVTPEVASSTEAVPALEKGRRGRRPVGSGDDRFPQRSRRVEAQGAQAADVVQGASETPAPAALQERPSKIETVDSQVDFSPADLTRAEAPAAPLQEAASNLGGDPGVLAASSEGVVQDSPAPVMGEGAPAQDVNIQGENAPIASPQGSVEDASPRPVAQATVEGGQPSRALAQGRVAERQPAAAQGVGPSTADIKGVEGAAQAKAAVTPEAPAAQAPMTQGLVSQGESTNEMASVASVSAADGAIQPEYTAPTGPVQTAPEQWDGDWAADEAIDQENLESQGLIRPEGTSSSSEIAAAPVGWRSKPGALTSTWALSTDEIVEDLSHFSPLMGGIFRAASASVNLVEPRRQKAFLPVLGETNAPEQAPKAKGSRLDEMVRLRSAVDGATLLAGQRAPEPEALPEMPQGAKRRVRLGAGPIVPSKAPQQSGAGVTRTRAERQNLGREFEIRRTAAPERFQPASPIAQSTSLAAPTPAKGPLPSGSSALSQRPGPQALVGQTPRQVDSSVAGSADTHMVAEDPRSAPLGLEHAKAAETGADTAAASPTPVAPAGESLEATPGQSIPTQAATPVARDGRVEAGIPVQGTPPAPRQSDFVNQQDTADMRLDPGQGQGLDFAPSARPVSQGVMARRSTRHGVDLGSDLHLPLPLVSSPWMSEADSTEQRSPEALRQAVQQRAMTAVDGEGLSVRRIRGVEEKTFQGLVVEGDRIPGQVEKKARPTASGFNWQNLLPSRLNWLEGAAPTEAAPETELPRRRWKTFSEAQDGPQGLVQGPLQSPAQRETLPSSQPERMVAEGEVADGKVAGGIPALEPQIQPSRAPSQASQSFVTQGKLPESALPSATRAEGQMPRLTPESPVVPKAQALSAAQQVARQVGALAPMIAQGMQVPPALKALASAPTASPSQILGRELGRQDAPVPMTVSQALSGKVQTPKATGAFQWQNLLANRVEPLVAVVGQGSEVLKRAKGGDKSTAITRGGAARKAFIAQQLAEQNILISQTLPQDAAEAAPMAKRGQIPGLLPPIGVASATIVNAEGQPETPESAEFEGKKRLRKGQKARKIAQDEPGAGVSADPVLKQGQGVQPAPESIPETSAPVQASSKAVPQGVKPEVHGAQKAENVATQAATPGSETPYLAGDQAAGPTEAVAEARATQTPAEALPVQQESEEISADGRGDTRHARDEHVEQSLETQDEIITAVEGSAPPAEMAAASQDEDGGLADWPISQPLDGVVDSEFVEETPYWSPRALEIHRHEAFQWDDLVANQLSWLGQDSGDGISPWPAFDEGVGAAQTRDIRRVLARRPQEMGLVIPERAQVVATAPDGRAIRRRLDPQTGQIEFEIQGDSPDSSQWIAADAATISSVDWDVLPAMAQSPTPSKLPTGDVISAPMAQGVERVQAQLMAQEAPWLKTPQAERAQGMPKAPGSDSGPMGERPLPTVVARDARMTGDTLPVGMAAPLVQGQAFEGVLQADRKRGATPQGRGRRNLEQPVLGGQRWGHLPLPLTFLNAVDLGDFAFNDEVLPGWIEALPQGQKEALISEVVQRQSRSSSAEIPSIGLREPTQAQADSPAAIRRSVAPERGSSAATPWQAQRPSVAWDVDLPLRSRVFQGEGQSTPTGKLTPERARQMRSSLGNTFSWSHLLPAQVGWLSGEAFDGPAVQKGQGDWPLTSVTGKLSSGDLPAGDVIRMQGISGRPSLSGLDFVAGIDQASPQITSEMQSTRPMKRGSSPQERWHLAGDIGQRWQQVAEDLAIAGTSGTGPLADVAQAARQFLEVDRHDGGRFMQAAMDMVQATQAGRSALPTGQRTEGQRLSPAGRMVQGPRRAPSMASTGGSVSRASLGFLFKPPVQSGAGRAQWQPQSSLIERFTPRLDPMDDGEMVTQAGARGFDSVSMTQIIKGLSRVEEKPSRAQKAYPGSPEDDVSTIRVGLAGLVKAQSPQSGAAESISLSKQSPRRASSRISAQSGRSIAGGAPIRSWAAERLSGGNTQPQGRGTPSLMGKNESNPGSLFAPSEARGMQTALKPDMGLSLSAPMQQALIQAESQPMQAPALFKEREAAAVSPPAPEASPNAASASANEERAVGLEEVIEEVRWRLQLEQKWQSELD